MKTTIYWIIANCLTTGAFFLLNLNPLAGALLSNAVWFLINSHE